MTDTLAFKLGWRLLAYPALIAAAAGFVFFWVYAHPKRFISSARPSLAHEAVKLLTSDGVELDAWFIPRAGAKASVIICHGYPMDKGDVLGMTSFLAKHFNLLYFDFRATGRSKGFFSTGGARETLDIDAAVEFLKTRNAGDKVGVFGFSMGAATALLAANPAIKARGLDSPFASLRGEMLHIFREFGALARPLVALIRLWGLPVLRTDLYAVEPVLAAAADRHPLLIIHGDADTQVPVESAYRIKEARPDAEIWIIPGAGHGECRELAGGEYERRFTEFFLKALK